MTQFRKKPIIIEAWQWTGQFKRPICGCDPEEEGYHIHTLEGPLHVSHGDWIITGVKGEQYPCKPDIFELTYEAVPSPHEDNDE